LLYLYGKNGKKMEKIEKLEKMEKMEKSEIVMAFYNLHMDNSKIQDET